MAKYYFSSESVSEGHPDKVSDQISDAVLDALLALDENAHVACETLTTTQKVVLAGEGGDGCLSGLPFGEVGFDTFDASEEGLL